jgi:hypothetical protein
VELYRYIVLKGVDACCCGLAIFTNISKTL